MSPILEARNVSKRFWIPTEERNSLREYVARPFSRAGYRELWALQDVSFAVGEGEWVGIIGLNGAGKSTVLKLFAGIYLPDGGTMAVEGRVVPLLELGIGFHPDLSCRDNIFLNGLILGLSRAKMKEKLGAIVAFAELEAFRDAKLKMLSTGMQARLAFSIAAHIEGDCYLFDEVFAVGDYEFQAKTQRVFEDLRRKRKTALFVSHNLGVIERFSDRVMLLEEGRLSAIGAPTEMIQRYTSVSSSL